MVRIINVDKKGLTIHHSSLTGGKKVRLEMCKEDVIELSQVLIEFINSNKINYMDEKQFLSRLYIEIYDKIKNEYQRFDYRTNIDKSVKEELAGLILIHYKNARLLDREFDNSNYIIEMNTVNYKITITIPYENFIQSFLDYYQKIDMIINKNNILDIIDKYITEFNNKYDQYSIFIYAKRSIRCRKYKLIEINIDSDTMNQELLDIIRREYNLKEGRNTVYPDSIIISLMKVGYEEINKYRYYHKDQLKTTLQCNGISNDEILSLIENNIKKCIYTKKELMEGV